MQKKVLEKPMKDEGLIERHHYKRRDNLEHEAVHYTVYILLVTTIGRRVPVALPRL